MLTVGSLCSGYEGLGLGLRLGGWPIELAWVADNDPGAARILAHRYPDVPNLGDITTVDWADVPAVDVVTAGFPCTDISCAGRMAGMGIGTRSGVWAYVVEAVAALRPRLVVVENVEALLSTPANRSTDGADSDVEPGPAGVGDGADRPVLRALGAVLGDLATLGFDAVWTTVSAASVGAPHRRNRVFLLAWPADTSGDPWRPIHGNGGTAANGAGVGHRDTGPEGGRGVPSAAVAGGAGADGLNLLPTPAATLGRGTGFPSRETAQDRMERGTRCLDDAVALLPTPAARDAGRGAGWGDQPGRPLSETVMRLAPEDSPGALGATPRATDGTKGGPNQRGSSGDLMLPSAVMLLPTPAAADGDRSSLTYVRGNPTLIGALLPTPTVADSRGTRNATAGRTPGAQYSEGWTLSDIAHADRWGQYAPAIARWEQVLGRPAPDPTEPGSKGQPRLSPRFVEWMQGLPDGWVTAVPGLSRNEQLRALGNGVVPQQCAAAVTHLVGLLP
jgi:site-specific DNA-cytosine methylase